MIGWSRSARRRPARDGVLIIVQNLPVPFDRRVWLECQALVADGHRVSVVCPRAADAPAFQLLDGVRILSYRMYAPGGGLASYLAEYAYSFLATLRLVVRAHKQHRFRVIQACNPPDIFWPIGLIAKMLGISFVFDHHDLCPELFRSRFPDSDGWALRVLYLLEHLTFWSADHVIATNESYRDVALGRGGKHAKDVTIVRTGPDVKALARVTPDLSLRRGHQHLCVYIGVMGPQDGVDNALLAADIIVNRWHRTDIAFTFIGSGDCFADLLELRDALGLGGYVEFTGRIPDREVTEIMSAATLGLSPDPMNALNDLCTMNKTMEYMAFALPVVAFDLRETRVSAAQSAMYAGPGDITGYAAAIVDLVDSPARRQEMGTAGRARVETALAWQHQSESYVGLYRELLGSPASATDGRVRLEVS